jgi:putative addiction module component (TIGR02574 family)
MTSNIDISQLSPAECILLAEELWDRASSHPDDVPPLTAAQQEELQRRLRLADRGETTYSPWSEVERRLLRPKE